MVIVGQVACEGDINQDGMLRVGPEGGFTDRELAQAQSHGWQVLDLGPRILRVETAAIALALWANGL
jgi:RsmE family RNA methyltransferase